MALSREERPRPIFKEPITMSRPWESHSCTGLKLPDSSACSPSNPQEEGRLVTVREGSLGLQNAKVRYWKHVELCGGRAGDKPGHSLLRGGENQASREMGRASGLWVLTQCQNGSPLPLDSWQNLGPIAQHPVSLPEALVSSP